MSKKMLIFAADLGIVPTITIQYYRVMEKVEICKLSIGGEIYRVIQGCEDGITKELYRVMKGRRIAKGGSFFACKRSAIQFMLRFAFDDVSQGTIEFEL